MKKIALLVALIAPTLAESEKSFLCLPKVSIGWENNENPFDIRKIEDKNKWLLQPIPDREIAFVRNTGKESLQANYSLTVLGKDRPWGFCNLRVEEEELDADTVRPTSLPVDCYAYNWPYTLENLSEDDKEILSQINNIRANKLAHGSEFVLAPATHKLWYYTHTNSFAIFDETLFGVSKYEKPILGLERGICEPF
jgi:hypothetical protein